MPGDFITTDLAAFLNSNELGDVAIYNGNTINVLFLNEHEAVMLFGLEVESASPLIMARDSDISGIQHGSTIVVSGITYKVIDIQPDGTGLTTLILSKD